MKRERLMRRGPQCRGLRRGGSILVLVALVLIPLLGMIALAVDYGYLLKAQVDLQRAADASALAAVLSLPPGSDGNQDLDAVRASVREYAAANAGNGFSVLDSDIVIGRFEPTTVYSDLEIVSTGIYDTVTVTLRRDGNANPRVPLYFARILGINQAGLVATATAALQKASGLQAGSDVLPFAVPLYEWEIGESWSIYGNGKILDRYGAEVPGNWGTVDIGLTNNSTSDLSDQIINGLRQKDLDALYGGGLIPDNTYFDADWPMWLQADPGLSSGMKHAIEQIIGMRRLVPIYNDLNDGHGNNLEYHVVGWGVVRVTGSNFQGSKNTYVDIEKSHLYDGQLRTKSDLTNETSVIEGAFASPVLLQ